LSMGTFAVFETPCRRYLRAFLSSLIKSM
jgi:hypothetical protein